MEAVKNTVLRQLGSGSTDLTSIAALTGVSPRTLRRALANGGCTYRALLDNVRRQQALKMAKDGQQSTSEIALALGYSEVSAFSRTWRRWFGESFTASQLSNGAKGT